MKRNQCISRYDRLAMMTVCLACCLLPGNRLLAQLRGESPLFNGERTFVGGLVLGGNMTQVDGDYLNGYHKVGVVAGGVAYVNFSRKMGVSMELLFSQKGSYSVSTLESPYYGSYFSKYSIRLNYAEVPVVLHYYIYERAHIGIGAAYNLLVSSKEEYNDASYNTVVDSKQYPFERHTLDGIASVSGILWQGLMLECRFQYSLMTIRKFSNIPQGLGFENQKSNMLSLRLMYLL